MSTGLRTGMLLLGSLGCGCVGIEQGAPTGGKVLFVDHRVVERNSLSRGSGIYISEVGRNQSATALRVMFVATERSSRTTVATIAPERLGILECPGFGAHLNDAGRSPSGSGPITLFTSSEATGSMLMASLPLT